MGYWEVEIRPPSAGIHPPTQRHERVREPLNNDRVRQTPGLPREAKRLLRHTPRTRQRVGQRRWLPVRTLFRLLLDEVTATEVVMEAPLTEVLVVEP